MTDERPVIRQVDVFMSNEVGRLAEVARILGRENINIRGFSVADSTDYGILRLIVADADHATKVLQSEGFTVTEALVICVDLPDRPGQLASVLEIFSERGINIDYVYSIVKSCIVFGLENAAAAAAAGLLRERGFTVLSQSEIAAL